MRRKRVLLASLDWGLGHAARCVPIIRALINKDAEVQIASSGPALAMLRQEFPRLNSFELPAYDPAYPTTESMVWKMGKQIPKFISAIKDEQIAVEKIIKQEKIDVLLSDNRYGCHSKLAHSIFITHQTNILMPDKFKWIEPVVNFFNREQIKKFDACWIPAVPGNPFSKLIAAQKHSVYIGYLSRLEKKNIPNKYDILALCTGPEPQRSVFEKMVLDELRKFNGKSLVVKSCLQEKQKYAYTENQVTGVNFLSSEEMSTVLSESNIVLSRSGFSTVMDLMKVGGKAIFVPTPGQTEQEYIAAELMKNHIAFSVSQKKFNLQHALQESKAYSGFAENSTFDELLEQAICNIL